MSNTNENNNTNTNSTTVNNNSLVLDQAALERWLNYNLQQRSVLGKGLKLCDIAEKLVFKTSLQFDLEQAQINQFAGQLDDKGFLFLSSPDCAVLDSAGEAIVEKLVNEHKYTPLVLRSSAIARDDFALDIEPLLVLKEGEEPAVILVEAIEDSSELFLKSIIRSPRVTSRVTESLRNIRRRLLILTRDRLLMGTDSRARFESKNGHIPYEQVSFLRPRLKKLFPEDFLSLEEELLRQRKAGFWAIDEEAFCWQVLETLEELRDRIKRNHVASAVTAAAAPPLREPEPSAQEPLVTACLFVAAFYPRLPVQDFNRLVLSLLDPVPRKDTCSSYKLSQGQGWVEEQPEPKSDRELWRESYQEVLKKCQLAVQPVSVRSMDGVYDTRVFVVDFQPPFAASKARETFLGLHYPLFLELVRHLRKAKPSFIFDSVSDIAKTTASLILASAETNPGELQVDWLLQLLQEANSARRQETSMETESPKQEEETRQGGETGNTGKEPNANAMAEGQEEKKQEPGAEEAKLQASDDLSFKESAPPPDSKAGEAAKGPYIRFQDLLHEMMRKPSLRETAVRLLHDLFSRRQIAALIELTWSLRDVERFEAFKWWERLLNEGNKPARDRVYSKILRMARNGEGTEVVPAVGAWLPEPKAQPISLSGIASFYFYVDLNAAYLFDPHRRRQGWPPSHPVLSTLAGMSEAESEGLIRWLFHPGLAPILESRAGDHFPEWIFFWLIPEALGSVFFEERHEDCRTTLLGRWVESGEALLAFESEKVKVDTLLFPAVVLADWAVELLGDDPPAPEARGLLDRLLAALVQVCDLERRRALEVLWTTIEESLLDLLVFLEQLDPRPADLDKATAAEVRRSLQSRRRSVKQLRGDLQARSRMAKVS